MKKCKKCDTLKNKTDFYKDKSQEDGLTLQCKECRKIASKETHLKHNEKRNFNRKFKHIKDLYGLDFNQYQSMLAEQQHKCGICDKTMNKPVVDHDHSTGKVRMFLCYGCNIMIGLAKDDPAILNRAIQYLNKFSS